MIKDQGSFDVDTTASITVSVTMGSYIYNILDI